MIDALATLAFPAVIGLAGLLAIRTFEESATKITAAFAGLDALKRQLAV
jgi:hypothetical protein